MALVFACNGGTAAIWQVTGGVDDVELSDAEKAAVARLKTLRVGVTVFDGLVNVHLRRGPLSEAGAACLEKIARLGTVFMTGRRLTVPDLTILQGLPIKGLVADTAEVTPSMMPAV